ncbi:MAG: hypothetical protein EBV06_10640 [Planctomycetia bacterium]|nr:hypothetical protein [Planctomycetia bacterium]
MTAHSLEPIHVEIDTNRVWLFLTTLDHTINKPQSFVPSKHLRWMGKLHAGSHLDERVGLGHHHAGAPAYCTPWWNSGSKTQKHQQLVYTRLF